MAEYGDLRGPLEKLIQLTKAVEKHTRCLACADSGGGDLPVQSTVSGDQDNVGDLTLFKSFVIVKTSAAGDDVNITTSDSNVYSLLELGEVFSDAATPGFVLPPISIGGSGTFKYHGIK